MFNYSFWADEAFISGLAVQLMKGQLSFSQVFTIMPYQKLNILFTMFFFNLFGISEFTARLPSLLFFIIGISVMFFLAKKLSNVYGGVLSAFLYAFSHLNLAYATQAKPYSALEAITLLIVLLLVNVKNEKKTLHVIFYHITLVCLLGIATLLHSIGVFLWIVYFVSIILSLKKSYSKEWFSFKTLKRSHVLALFALCVAGYFIFPMVTSLFGAGSPFKYNNIYQIVKLFTYKYIVISTCSVFGFIWITKKNKELHIGMVLYSLVLFVFVAFVAYTFTIRYVLSLFGILFLYFGIFWAKVGEKYDENLKFKIYNLKLSGKIVIPLAVVLLLYATGYKIVRLPQTYYNPNIDKYGDVQIANYKDFYSELKQKFPDYKNAYVVNDTFDAEYWYFGRYSNAYFMKGTTTPTQHSVVKQAMMYRTLDDFKKIVKGHPQGLLIMEDWQSFLPDDIKMYAKKNLKLELRVESLKEATDDPWPLALYSWGY
ncbi:MAG: glycosyltransferase family 39 protein [Candidatus Roizmanbacteria bacterium]|nr:glycosyltransferase family 39 protein [Candidatus Roizmanbacteria bacterium]